MGLGTHHRRSHENSGMIFSLIWVAFVFILANYKYCIIYEQTRKQVTSTPQQPRGFQCRHELDKSPRRFLTIGSWKWIVNVNSLPFFDPSALFQFYKFGQARTSMQQISATWSWNFGVTLDPRASKKAVKLASVSLWIFAGFKGVANDKQHKQSCNVHLYGLKPLELKPWWPTNFWLFEVWIVIPLRCNDFCFSIGGELSTVRIALSSTKPILDRHSTWPTIHLRTGCWTKAFSLNGFLACREPIWLKSPILLGLKDIAAIRTAVACSNYIV